MFSETTTNNLKKIFRRALYLLPVLVLVNVIFSAFTTGPEAFTQLQNFSLLYFSLSLCLALVPWITHSLRTYIWTHFLGHRISFIECVRISIGSDLGAAASPTAVGGSPVKAAMLISSGLEPAKTLFIALVTTFEDTTYLSLSFLVVASLMMHFFPQSMIDLSDIKFFKASLLLYLALGILVIWVLYKIVLKRFEFFRRVVAWLQHIRQDMIRVFKFVRSDGKKVFLLSFCLNVLQWFVRYLIIYTLFLSIGIRVSFFETMLLAWFVYFAIIFVPTPGAVLGAEASFYFIYGSLLSSNVLGLVTFGWRFLTFYFQLSIGVFVFLGVSVIKRFYHRLFSYRTRKLELKSSPLPGLDKALKVED